jgi:hypothetical protein
MQSKEYIYKLFLLTFFSILIIFITFYAFHNKYHNNSLISKEYLIKFLEPTLIFAGDSRAERQLNPEIAANLLNIEINKVVNIAVSSGDSLMIEDLINKYPQKFKNAILIISISQNQLNDNAKREGYFSNDMISKLPFWDQIRIFSTSNQDTLLKYYKNNIEYYLKQLFNIKLVYYNAFENTNGFYGINKNFDYNSYSNVNYNDIPWYENYNNELIKINLLKKNLINIKNSVRDLYIYTGPILPKHLDNIRDTNDFNIEMKTQDSLKDLCKELNIKYKSYAFDNRFVNENFYDPFHLNKIGANIFTEILLKDFHISF